MPNQGKGRRLPFVTTVGLAALGAMILFSVFAGGAVSAPQGTAEMPTPRSGPGIIGKLQEGETLQATGGQWLYANGLNCASRPAEPCIITWAWRLWNPGLTSFITIAGATSDTLLLTQAHVGGRIQVVQTLTKNDCDAHGANCRDTSSSQVSAPTGLVAPKPVSSPVNRELPVITGTPMEEETLTASTGIWDGPQPISLTWQWYRSDTNGNNPSPIAGANAQTYKLTTADVGFRIKVTGTATNAGGSSFATSEPTPVIVPFGPTATRRSVTVDRVSLPHRLIIDQFQFTPQPLRSRNPFIGRFHVSDTRGFAIQGALVKATGVPTGLVRNTAEIATTRNGWATFRFQPTNRLELRKGASLAFFVCARKPGESRRAGVSMCDLFYVKIAAAPATTATALARG
jgi:hypothetical protein